MAGMSSYLQNKIVDHIFRARAYTAPAKLWVGLMAVAPATDADAGTEVTGTDYGRASPGDSGDTTWIATQDTPGNPGSAAASNATAGRTANGALIDFGEPGSGGWDDAVGIGVFDAETEGNLLYYKSLASSQQLPEGVPVRIPIGSLTVTHD